MKVWAMLFANGRVLADSDFKSAADVWRVALGWPSNEEIEAAKKRGDMVTQLIVRVSPQTGEVISPRFKP